MESWADVQVCKATGVDPSDIQYVEAHGTGTVVGDSQELSAIDGLYGAGAGHTPEEPLLIGSVKSNMGHCEGCSGLAGARVLPQLACAASWHATARCFEASMSSPCCMTQGAPTRSALGGHALRLWRPSCLSCRPMGACTAVHYGIKFAKAMRECC